MVVEDAHVPRQGAEGGTLWLMEVNVRRLARGRGPNRVVFLALGRGAFWVAVKGLCGYAGEVGAEASAGHWMTG